VAIKTVIFEDETLFCQMLKMALTKVSVLKIVAACL